MDRKKIQLIIGAVAALIFIVAGGAYAISYFEEKRIEEEKRLKIEKERSEIKKSISELSIVTRSLLDQERQEGEINLDQTFLRHQRLTEKVENTRELLSNESVRPDERVIALRYLDLVQDIIDKQNTSMKVRKELFEVASRMNGAATQAKGSASPIVQLQASLEAMKALADAGDVMKKLLSSTESYQRSISDLSQELPKFSKSELTSSQVLDQEYLENFNRDIAGLMDKRVTAHMEGGILVQ